MATVDVLDSVLDEHRPPLGDGPAASATVTGADDAVVGADGVATAADAGTDNTIAGDEKEHPRAARKPPAEPSAVWQRTLSRPRSWWMRLAQGVR